MSMALDKKRIKHLVILFIYAIIEENRIEVSTRA